MKNWNTDVTKFKTAKDRKIWVGKTVLTANQQWLLDRAATAEIIFDSFCLTVARHNYSPGR